MIKKNLASDEYLTFFQTSLAINPGPMQARLLSAIFGDLFIATYLFEMPFYLIFILKNYFAIKSTSSTETLGLAAKVALKSLQD